MTAPEYVTHTTVKLKNHADFSEAWLQDRICEDPSILGLGEVEVLDRERTQDRAGRLDLLLVDTNTDRRYEVELMLGATDPSHIVRCIEYWDIERRRYPAYDHVAVLVAENVTSRFLNFMSLLSGTIPLIAIQLTALQVEDKVTLSFIRVLDQTSLREDDESGTTGARSNRADWEAKVGENILEMADRVIEVVNACATVQLKPNYKQRYIGLLDRGRARNFVYITPKKNFVHILVTVSNLPDWITRLEEHDLPVTVMRRKIRVTLTPKAFEANQEVLQDLIQQSVKEYES